MGQDCKAPSALCVCRGGKGKTLMLVGTWIAQALVLPRPTALLGIIPLFCLATRAQTSLGILCLSGLLPARKLWSNQIIRTRHRSLKDGLAALRWQ